MLVNKKYQVISDVNSIMLQERVVAKSGKYEGEESWRTVGWYSTFKGCLIGLVSRKVKETALKDMKTIISEMDEIRNDIYNLDFSEVIDENRAMQSLISELKAENSSLKQKISKLEGKEEKDEQ